MTCLDSLEVAGRADVGLGQLLLLAFGGLLVLAGQAAVAQHVVEVVRLLVAVGVGVESNVVDLWILYVHCGHGQSWTCGRKGAGVGIREEHPSISGTGFLTTLHRFRRRFSYVDSNVWMIFFCIPLE